MCDPGIAFSGELSLGEAIVGAGTLALAGVTGWLARRTSAQVELTEKGLELTRESIEAQDRPFLVATPDREEAIGMWGTHEVGSEKPGEPEMVLSIRLENWGRGPAILEGVSVRGPDGAELVSDDWKVEMGILPEDEPSSVGVGLDEAKDFPGVGDELTLQLVYRSASGATYETIHRMEAIKRLGLIRLDFKRRLVRSADSPLNPSSSGSTE